MYIDGENTVVTDPDRTHCEHALRSLDFLVVTDLFMTDTAELADVVFPAAAWAEVDGTQTNTERRIQRLRAAVPPQGDAMPDWWITSQLAKRMGFQGFDYEGPQDVFNECCELSAIYQGVSWDEVEHGEYQWPVPFDGHPGTPRLHEEEFVNGRGIFSIAEYRDPAETIDDDYPVWLTTGRRLASYHTRTQTGRSAGIEYLLSEEVLEVHPTDVEQWGLEDGGCAIVSSRRGSVRVKVQANNRSPKGDGLHHVQLQRRSRKRAHRIRVRSHHADRGVEGLRGACGARITEPASPTPTDAPRPRLGPSTVWSEDPRGPPRRDPNGTP